MENPAHWKPLEVVINDAIGDYEALLEEAPYTVSMASYIAREIRERGLIDDRDALPVGWEELRRHHDERERRRERNGRSRRPSGDRGSIAAGTSGAIPNADSGRPAEENV